VDAEQVPVGVLELHRDGRIVSMNAVAREALDGLSDLGEAVDATERQRIVGHLEHVLATGEGQRTHLEVVLRGVPMLLTSSRCGSDAVVATLTDITSLHRQMQDLEHRSFTDELTGVANRGLFMRLLAQTLNGAERTKARTAVLFIDVDNFKAVNDTHGHAAGDAVLVEIARRLRRVVRPNDLVARVGGDEFVILAEDLDDEEAGAVARRVLALCSAPLSIGGPSVAVSVSVGVTVEDPGAHPQSSVARADTAMYAAKAAGRATFVAWTPRMTEGPPADEGSELAALQAANRELRTRYQQLRSEAGLDARTGLLRDQAFEDHVRALRTAAVEFSVVFVDIDLFHGYNERYTHIAGHRALADVATVLKQDTGVQGSVFRYGGEEFTIVIPRTEATTQEAEDLARRLPGAVAACDLVYDTSPFGRITVSVGVAHTEHAGDDVTAWANVAMLEAKHSGRNRTRVVRDR
jgi:diguanylate cyclase (GGDEF)-like protein